MLPPFPARPAASISRIIGHMEPYGEIKKLAPRQRLVSKCTPNSYVYLFRQGGVSVLRSTDSLLLSTTFEPDVFGFAEMFSPMEGKILRAESECVYCRVETSRALQLVIEHDLWHDVATVLSFHVNRLLLREMKIINQPSLSIIWHHLAELDLLPDEIKERTSIANYIQDRTGLSRSSIMNAISMLKNSGAIHYSRGGYALEVKRLPESLAMAGEVR